MLSWGLSHLVTCYHSYYPDLSNPRSVLLRQNPHNVDEWHKRVALFEGSPTQMVRTYTDAVKTVDTSRAVGTSDGC
jgi:pre-mRNA-splicing factor SYF1